MYVCMCMCAYVRSIFAAEAIFYSLLYLSVSFFAFVENVADGQIK